MRWPFPSDQRRWDECTICCFELASLDVLISADSRFKPVGGEIWYPFPQWECWSQKAPYCLTRKNVIFSDAISFFRIANRTSGTTQKAQCKNITEKRKRDEKYMWENSPKKWFFLEFCFAPALARPKKRNYFAQNRFPKYRCFFDVRGQKNGKNSTPSAMGETPWSKYVSAERKNVFGKNPQKSSFFGEFVFWGFFEIKTA